MSDPLFPTQTALNLNTGDAGVTFNNSTNSTFIPTVDNSVTPLRWFLVTVVKAEDTQESLAQWSSFIGICIAIIGNVLISLALNVQKYAHTRLEQDAMHQRARILHSHRLNSGHAWDQHENIYSDDEDQPLHSTPNQRDEFESSRLLLDPEKPNKKSFETYISSPYWWLGFFLMFVGECGNFLAYGFAPASIVSPLGVVALVSNCVFAPLMLKEPFRGRDVVGVMVSIAGAVIVVWSAEKEETKLGPDEILEAISQTAFEVYFTITCVLIVTLMHFSSRHGHKTSTIDLGLVALFGSFTVLSTKGISSLISSSFYRIFQYPIAYLFTFVLASTAVLQVKYINRALQRFDSTQVIPTQFVLFTISVILGSVILYRDFETVGFEQMSKFATGCSLTFIGVYLISSQRARYPTNRFSDEPSIEDESDHYESTLSAIVPSATVGSSTTPFAAQTKFHTGLSTMTVSSNSASVERPGSSDMIAQKLQSALTDTLLLDTGAKKKLEGDLLSPSVAGLFRGSSLLTGYQLQTLIAEHVGGSLRNPKRQRNIEQTIDRETEDDHENQIFRNRGRGGSFSVGLDFVKARRESFIIDQYQEIDSYTRRTRRVADGQQ